jgi:hypothetical protein
LALTADPAGAVDRCPEAEATVINENGEMLTGKERRPLAALLTVIHQQPRSVGTRRRTG